MSDNEKIIREFFEAWSRLDADEMVSYFTEDGIYHNMPIEPVAGHENLREFIKDFTGDWSGTSCEIVTLVAQGSLVIAERIDRPRMGDIQVNLPCIGVFEMVDGKIKVWREYFDLATFINAASGEAGSEEAGSGEAG